MISVRLGFLGIFFKYEDILVILIISVCVLRSQCMCE